MPDIAPRRQLSNLVRAHLKRAGFEPDDARARVKPCVWHRPPLFTEMELAGEPLQRHLVTRIHLDIEDTVDVYERFLGGFLYSSTLREAGSVRWLGRALDLSLYAAKHVFPAPQPGKARLGLHLHAVQLAALVAYNFDATVEQSPDTFAVEVGDFVFGIQDGQVLSNLNQRPRARTVKGLRAPQDGNLSSIARGMARLPTTTSSFDACRRWIASHREELNAAGPDTDIAVDMALEILWWRYAGHFPSRLQELRFNESSDKYLHLACEQAREFEHFARPMIGLYEIFVPQFLSRREFTGHFGNHCQPLAVPLSNRMKAKWEAAIEDLDPGPQ